MKLIELREKYQKEIDAASTKMNHLYKHISTRRQTEVASVELKEFIEDKKTHIEIIEAFIEDINELKKQLS